MTRIQRGGLGRLSLARADTCPQWPFGADPSPAQAPLTEVFLLAQILREGYVCKPGSEGMQPGRRPGKPGGGWRGGGEGSFGAESCHVTLEERSGTGSLLPALGSPFYQGPARRIPSLFPLCSHRKEGRDGLVTLPSVGGCPRSSPRSSPAQTFPSGCPPSAQSCPSGWAPLAPRRSPWAAAAPGGPPQARFAGAVGCQAGCSGRVTPLSPSTAGARAVLGP